MVEDYQWLCESFLPEDVYKKELNEQIQEYGEDGIDWTDIWYNNMHKSKIDTIHENGKIKLGRRLATSSNSEIDNGNVSLEELLKIRNELEKIIPDVKDSDFKLFYGSYYC
ncbi:MAG: hypothetical protein HPY57_15110 [Ignavibacteria bacterium]|nr:hypothetical protein [Ignavibacteria bacterium]